MESEQEFPSPPSQRAETDLAGPSTGEQHTVPDVKPPGPQRGYKRKLGNSRSATPGTVQNSDDEASRRSSETPTGHRYGLTGPDEDARLRACARMGTKVAGSGDGGERGEECFFWIDLPMNRTGSFPFFEWYSASLKSLFSGNSYRIPLHPMRKRSPIIPILSPRCLPLLPSDTSTLHPHLPRT
jgi:hypothetical protein